MMTIFSKNTLPAIRRKGKNANNLSEANININTEEVSRFDAWFTSSYTRLKNKIASFSKVDEDTFITPIFLSGRRSCTRRKG